MQARVFYRQYRRGNKYLTIWTDDLTGKRHQKSFPTQEAAIAHAEMLRAREEKLTELLRTGRKTPRKSGITVEELIRLYLAGGGLSPLTRKQNSYHLRPIVALFGTRKAACLSAGDMAFFNQQQQLLGLCQTTINRRVNILKAALNWGLRTGVLRGHGLTAYRAPTARTRRIQPPTPDELRAIHAHAATHIRRVLMFGTYCGPRIGPSELFRLRWDCVDFSLKIIYMPNANKGAREESREIPIRRDFLHVLRDWAREDAERGCAYCIHWRGRPVRCIRNGWCAALRRAGIERRLTPYSLRHAYATYSLRGGAKIKALAKVMGHANETMILKTYQHLLEGDERAVVEAMPDIFRIGASRPPRKRRKLPPQVVLAGEIRRFNPMDFLCFRREE